MVLLGCFIFGMITFLMTGARCEATEVFAEAGSQAVLPCKFSPTSLVASAIVWTKVNRGTVWRKKKSGLQYWGSSWLENGNQRVRCPHSQFERGDYSLQINNVREEDAGLYSCSEEFGENVNENMVMLRIITVSTYPSVPIWGGEILVTCNMTPWPNKASVRWMLNNNPFVRQTEPHSKGGDSENTVREKATARLTGNWTCVVGYEGKEGRATASLSVTGITQPPDDNTKVYAAVGSAVTLPCVFSPGLIPSLALWEKLQPGSIFIAAPVPLRHSFSQFPWDKSASLKEVGFKDEGKYRCSGNLQGQRLTRSIQLVVAKIETSVPSVKDRSVTLTCQLSDTSEVTRYEWVHLTYDANGTQSVGSIEKGKTLTISQLSEDKWGEWACQFYGKQGILGNVTYHVQLMSGLSGQKSTGLSHNTGVIVGLSFLLVILLLILAQMYKNHQRRKRIFQYPALETIVHTISNEREERERNRVKT